MYCQFDRGIRVPIHVLVKVCLCIYIHVVSRSMVRIAMGGPALSVSIYLVRTSRWITCKKVTACMMKTLHKERYA